MADPVRPPGIGQGGYSRNTTEIFLSHYFWIP